MLPYEIRGAVLTDEDQLLAVAHHLNTVNLPDDRTAIRAILDHAHKSFTGAVKDPKRREYVFVLVDTAENKIVGTSMVIAQLGRRDAPYIYFDVIEEERYSATLDRHFSHTTLSIGYSYNGPTEIGGLILAPEYRKAAERLGQFISYVRFLYIRMHRDLFRDEVLAELLPPLEPDGTSHLWDAVGHKFTGLTYAEADRLSKQNKEFIRGLFPEGPIYATLLSPKAQEVIGKVGIQTRGVEKMLRRIGFRYAERVDPFDGGPHFTAPTDEISLVKRARAAKIAKISPEPIVTNRSLVAVESKEPPFFRCVLAACASTSDDTLVIAEDAATQLGLNVGDEVWVLPLD
ncbi:MAG: arginine N-succinyltransferase [Polyangiaceae bacterium]|jgi:arginine N-succinyltransferase